MAVADAVEQCLQGTEREDPVHRGVVDRLNGSEFDFDAVLNEFDTSGFFTQEREVWVNFGSVQLVASGTWNSDTWKSSKITSPWIGVVGAVDGCEMRYEEVQLSLVFSDEEFYAVGSELLAQQTFDVGLVGYISTRGCFRSTSREFFFRLIQRQSD